MLNKKFPHAILLSFICSQVMAKLPDLARPDYFPLAAIMKEIDYQPAPISAPRPRPSTAPTPAPVLSVGQQRVQDALAKNRELLKQRKLEEPSKREAKDGNDDFASLGKKTQELYGQWKKETETLYQDWQKQMAKERASYLKELPTIKKNLVPSDVYEKSVTTESSFQLGKEAKLTTGPALGQQATQTLQEAEGVALAENFLIPVRHQKGRPTCSAFAAIRAIEVLLLNTRQKAVDLSEQYFYFASKKDCQTSPCQKKGSMERYGFQFSRLQPRPDIPLERDCPYNENNLASNETQIPLGSGCLKGAVKVDGFAEALGMGEIRSHLDQGHPVIASARLSENFYRNQGVVYLKDATAPSASKDQHALGHSFVLVGHLPIDPKKNEGSVCYLAVNSWGPGWGKGGHACLSEKWMEAHRFRIPFIALTSVSTVDSF